MSFVARAYKSHERGDTLRGVFILITGLRRDPYNEEGLDALIDLYSRNSTLTGLEHEIIEVLVQRDDADEILSVLCDNLDANTNKQSAEKLIQLGKEAGIEYLPEPEKPEPKIIIQSTPEENTARPDPEMAKPVTRDIPPEIDYEPEAETIDIERDDFHNEPEEPPKKLNWKVILILSVMFIFVSSLSLYFSSQKDGCKSCSKFDLLIVSWPESVEKLRGLSEKHPDMNERRTFLSLMSNPAQERQLISSPKTWYGIASNGIVQNQLCANRDPVHIAIAWCRISYFDKRDDNQNLEQSIAALKLRFPLFNTKQKGKKSQNIYGEDDPIRSVFHALFSDFHQSENGTLSREIARYPQKIEQFPDHQTKTIVDALNAISAHENENADLLLSNFLKKDLPPRLIALIQAIFPRAFLYQGDVKRAAKFSAPLGGNTVEGDRARPRSLKINPITIISESWEAEEAVFSRVELLAETGNAKLSLTILGQLKDLGTEYARTQQMQEVISCLAFSECRGTKSPKGKTISRWLAADVEVEIEDSPWTGFLKGIPGTTLEFEPSGALNRWWYDRLQLIAAGQHGRGNSVWKGAYKNFRAVGTSAALARGLSKFWQGDYSGANLIFAKLKVPIAVGFSGLSHRALGEGVRGNKQLNDAGLRFNKKGGADFELGILNERFGQRERANGYFWRAWKQDWSRENALIKWCKTLPPNSYSHVRDRLKRVESIDMARGKRERIVAIRDTCLLKMRASNKTAKLQNIADDEIALPYWVLASYGELAFEHQKFSTSRTFFKQAQRINPTDPEILYGAGRCAQKDQDSQVAKSLAKRYIELWPNGPRKVWAEGLR